MPIKAVATPQAREAARAPVIAEIRAGGIIEPYAIAAALTARGIPTARGHRFWMTGPMRNLLNRLDRLAAADREARSWKTSSLRASEEGEKHP
jgi:hypothetical protein